MNATFRRLTILTLAAGLLGACAQKASQDLSSANPNNVGAQLNLGTDLPYVTDVRMTPSPQDGIFARTGVGPFPGTPSREVCVPIVTPGAADEAFFYVTFNRPMRKTQTQAAVQIMHVTGDVSGGKNSVSPASAGSVNFTWDTPTSSSVGKILTVRVEGLPRNHTYLVQVGSGAQDAAGNPLDGKVGAGLLPLPATLDSLNRPDDDFLHCPSVFQSIAFSYCSCVEGPLGPGTAACPELPDIFYATLRPNPRPSVAQIRERTHTLSAGGAFPLTANGTCLDQTCADHTYLSIGPRGAYALATTNTGSWSGWQVVQAGRLVTLGAEFQLQFSNVGSTYSRSGRYGIQSTDYAANVELRDLSAGQVVPIEFSYDPNGPWASTTADSSYDPASVYFRPAQGASLAYSHVYQVRVNASGTLKDFWGNAFVDGSPDGNDLTCAADDAFLVQFATIPDPNRLLAENATVRPYTLLPNWQMTVLPEWPNGRTCTIQNGSIHSYEVTFVVPHATDAANGLSSTQIDDRVPAGQLTAQNVILFDGANGTGNPVPYDPLIYEDYTGDLFPDPGTSYSHSSPSGVTEANLYPVYQNRVYIPTTVLRLNVDNSVYALPQSLVLSGRITVNVGGTNYALDGNRDFISGGYPAAIALDPSGKEVTDDVILPLGALTACPR